MKTHEHNHDSDPLSNLLRETIAGEPLPPANPSLREALLKRLDQPLVQPALSTAALSAAAASRRRTFFQRAGIALASTAALAIVGVLWQRPDLQVIGWNEPASQPAAVQNESAPRADFSNKNDPSATSSTAAPSPESRESLDKLAEVDAAHHPFSLEEPQPAKAGESVRGMNRRFNGNEVFETQPTDRRFGDVAGGGSISGLAPSAPGPGGNVSGPHKSLPPGSVPAGYAEGKPASGRVSGDDLAAASSVATKAPDAFAAPKPTATTPKFNAPQGGPVVASTPRILVQEETKDRLGFEFESKGGQGQGLPAGLKPGEQPASNLYNESAGKNVVDKRLKAIEDRVTATKTVTKSEIAEQLSRAKVTRDGSGVLAESVESDGEVRDKFNKVVALTDELNRARRLSELQPRVEREKLDQLATAIEEVRKLEARYRFVPQPGGEQYARIVENQFLHPNTAEEALSTFSIDVDTASYANVRRFLNNGQLPPPDAVRLEELVNYFKYKYPQPKGDDPFSVNMEMADCPWHPGHKLLRVGLQGKEIHRAERPASNLVFLIDTSGSMTDENKLPLLKTAFTMLVGELNENDKVTIVTYAGNAGLRLPPTRGHEKGTINAAIEGMQSGGSTHGSAGISLAYEIAAAQFIKGGTNKVILATDGDLNVGITDDSALVELITKKAETGVYLTVLGVGTGNLKDAKMERLADNGNGIYAYLDSLKEARKVLVEEMSGSLVTIAKDVKIQLEFNPAEVESYRLLGYENRVMANKDFRNDAKDAGEIGAGHSVTALYEVALVGSGDAAVKAEATPKEEPLKYQRVAAEALKYQSTPEATKLQLTDAAKSGELLTLRLRYKKPDATKEDAAKELQFPLKDKGGNFNSASQDFQFASAVVAFGLSLRNSEFRGGANLSAVSEIATAGIGEDPNGHRAEFLDLVRRAKTLRGE